jgi:hypothetical protein
MTGKIVPASTTGKTQHFPNGILNISPANVAILLASKIFLVWPCENARPSVLEYAI